MCVPCIPSLNIKFRHLDLLQQARICSRFEMNIPRLPVLCGHLKEGEFAGGRQRARPARQIRGGRAISRRK